MNEPNEIEVTKSLFPSDTRIGQVVTYQNKKWTVIGHSSLSFWPSWKLRIVDVPEPEQEESTSPVSTGSLDIGELVTILASAKTEDDSSPAMTVDSDRADSAGDSAPDPAPVLEDPDPPAQDPPSDPAPDTTLDASNLA